MQNETRTIPASKLVIVTPEMVKKIPELQAYYDASLFDSKGNPKTAKVGLKENIKSMGLINPVTVNVVQVAGNAFPVVVAGRERTRAMQELEAEGWIGTDGVIGGAKINLVNVDAKGAAMIRIAENLQRKDITWTEKANDAVYLRETFKMSYEEVANVMGSNVASVKQWIDLKVNTTPAVLQAIDRGLISPTAAAKNLTTKEFRLDDGTPNTTKINSTLKTMLTESAASGDKKVRVANANQVRTNKANTPLALSQLRYYATAANTPAQIALFLKYATGLNSLQDVKAIAANEGIDFDWLQPVVIDKAAVKAAKKAERDAKKDAAKAKKDAKKKETGPVTSEDIDSLFS